MNPPLTCWERQILWAYVRRALPDSRDYHPPRAVKIIKKWHPLIERVITHITAVRGPGKL